MINKEEYFFPYEVVRGHQEELIKEVRKCAENRENILIHAPTGIGKTISVLSPLVSYAAKNDLTIFFLTPRHMQHKIVIDTMRLIKEKFNANITVVDFIGKKWMCAQNGVDFLSSGEFGEYCRDLIEKGSCVYYENFKNKKLNVKKDLILDAILKDGPMHVQDVVKKISKEKFCPFEMSAVLAQKAKVVVMDYYHLLNPNIRKSILARLNKELERSIIVFDECHNLPEKCRKILTDQINTRVIDLAIKEVGQFNGGEGLKDSLLEIGNLLLGLSKKIPLDKSECLVEKKDFSFEDYDSLIEDLGSFADEVREEKKRSYVGSVVNFLELWRGNDHGFSRILTKGFLEDGRAVVKLKYSCLDPSLITKELIVSSYSVIGMSGTLTPLEMYKDLLGFENVKLLEYENPFPKKNQLSLIVPGVTTKFSARNEKMYRKIALKCACLVNAVSGNSIVFFPSYNTRDEVNLFFERWCKRTTFLEQKGMNKHERDELIEKFKSYKDKGAVLLAVSNGSFGEGIDLIGDFLKAVFVVGIPLTKPDLEVQMLIDYYEGRFKKGWDYGYIYPAIITTIQNAGRCIRSENDKGVVVFLDERYKWGNYFKCFPKDKNFIITETHVQKINEFFKD